ncbi:hypothetical protein [Kutzneria sp. CA-103260]|uniref:hypothetical protein n=1 Tax=Kutzneria sp. CA-103260 TaxID=2802641 RepID=UPI001BABB7AC|nr:hypothetical protein [Kutzneria sp. CA-103260]
MQLITFEQIVAPFFADDWEDPTGDRDEPRFRRQFTDDIAITVGLNPVTRESSVRFSPSLGVQHVATSRLATEFLGRPPDAGVTLSSTGITVEDVLHRNGFTFMTTFERWQITSPQQSVTVAETIYNDVVEYGLPEFSAVRSLGDLIERLRGERRHQMQTGHLAIACALADSQVEAESALREFAAPMQKQQGAMLDQTRRFITGFVEHFGFGAEHVN